MTVLMASIAVSCTKDPKGGEEPGSKEYSPTVEAEVTLSTAIPSGLAWAAGSEIAVCQYGFWKNDTRRDATKNILTLTGGNKFSGTIANYNERDTSSDGSGTGEDSTEDCFLAVSPASSCSAYSAGTGEFTVYVQDKQSGLLADLTANEIFLGSLRGSDIVSSDAKSETLGFLKSFAMYSMTPVLKFTVPAELGAMRIVITALDATGAGIPLAGSIVCKSNAEGMTVAAGSGVTVSRGNDIVSGDVYVAVAPSECPSAGVFRNSAAVLNFDVTDRNGLTATIPVTLPAAIGNSAVVSVPDLPASIVPEPENAVEITGVEVYGTDGTPTGQGGRLYVYVTEGAELYSLVEGAYSPYGEYGSSEAGRTILEVRATKDKYADLNCTLWNWALCKTKGFGKYGIDNGAATYSQYDLTFVREEEGTNYAYPNTKGAGIDFVAGGKYAKGYLKMTVPATGTARFYVQSTGASKKMTVKKGSETIATVDLGSGQGCVSSETLQVTAGDVLEMHFSGSVTVNSITYMWQAAGRSSRVGNEAYSSRKDYVL